MRIPQRAAIIVSGMACVGATAIAMGTATPAFAAGPAGTQAITTPHHPMWFGDDDFFSDDFFFFDDDFFFFDDC